MNRAVNQRHQGFTLVELMVAMAFVSVLMLAIAMAVIQISNIYNKGLTMRAVDQAGRALSTEIRQTLSQSEPFRVDTALRYQKYPESSSTAPDGGRFCTGTYTYIWNFGKSMKAPINKYLLSDEEIRFVKVRDNGGVYCADPTRGIVRSDAVELLSGGDRDLAIQKLQVTQLADDPSTRQALYRVVLEIGTNSEDTLYRSDALNSVDTSCKPPSDDASMDDFCAVNLFDFTAQAGNKGDV